MPKQSKNFKATAKLVDATKHYSLEEAIKLARETSKENFDTTFDLVFKLNVDTTQADQQIRTTLSLPEGTGKKTSILAISEEEVAGADKTAGIDFIDAAKKAGKIDFDVIITTPKMMPKLAKYGQFLGPKGMMPNPKDGTVSADLAKVVAEIKRGKVSLKTDKDGNVHVSIGKKSFTDKQLASNATTIIETITGLRPSSVKGKFVTNISVSTTMGRGVKVSFETN